MREAGFIELLDETNTWRVTRYADEQDNQAETRKKWAMKQQAKRERDGNKPGDKLNVTGDIPVTLPVNKQQTESNDNQQQTEPNTADADLIPKSEEQSRGSEYTEKNPIPETENTIEENLRAVLDKWHSEMPEAEVDSGLANEFAEALARGKTVEDIHGVIELTRKEAKKSRSGFCIKILRTQTVIPAERRHIHIYSDGSFNM